MTSLLFGSQRNFRLLIACGNEPECSSAKFFLFVNDIMSLLTSILDAAVSEGLIVRNPAKMIGSLRRTEMTAAETIHRALTIEETRAFLDASDAQHN